MVDYQAFDQVAILSVSSISDTLGGGKIFAKLDLASGYWQVPVNPQHIPKTAFVNHLGLFDFLRVHMSLKQHSKLFNIFSTPCIQIFCISG